MHSELASYTHPKEMQENIQIFKKGPFFQCFRVLLIMREINLTSHCCTLQSYFIAVKHLCNILIVNILFVPVLAWLTLIIWKPYPTALLKQ